MRILLVTNYQPPHMGGIEFAGQSLKACWERDGHEVTWLTTDVPRRPDLTARDNVRIRANNLLESTLQINSPLVYPWEHHKIARLIASHDVCNVHSLAPGLSNVALNLALRARHPLVVTQHVAVIPLRWKFLSVLQHHFVTAMSKRVLHGGATLTFVGKAVREWFVREAGLDEHALPMTPAGIDQATYHFVDENERRALRSKWKLDGGGLRVLYVGRFYEKKGLHLIRELAVRCPDIRFTFVGGGPIQPRTWQLPNVAVMDYVSSSDLRELYGAHDLFIMPSHGEGWPAVVPQAMACGLACMVSKECFSGYGRDEDRFIVCSRDVVEMADLLQRAAQGGMPLLGDRSSLSRYACDNWDWQRTARIYLELFRQATAAKP